MLFRSLQLWSWKENIEAGKSCFETKVKNYCADYKSGSVSQLKCGYTSYNGSDDYGKTGSEIVSEIGVGKYRKGWF